MSNPPVMEREQARDILNAAEWWEAGDHLSARIPAQADEDAFAQALAALGAVGVTQASHGQSHPLLDGKESFAFLLPIDRGYSLIIKGKDNLAALSAAGVTFPKAARHSEISWEERQARRDAERAALDGMTL